MVRNIFVTLFMILLGTTIMNAQESFPNTMHLDSLSGSPDATLADISWIEGHWRGRAFGGIVEDLWSPPLGNSMMCAFKLVVDDKVKFYELLTISEENETLMLRLKHFHGDLKGWEEKDETVDFPLVKVTDNKVFFDGFTFERISANRINIYVIIQNKEGKQEMKFSYERVI